ALFELEWTRKNLIGVSHLIDFDALRNLLPAALLQFRLRVEQIHLARPAVLHEVNHRLRRRREMRRSWLQILCNGLCSGFLIQQISEREAADAEARGLKEGTAIEHGIRSYGGGNVLNVQLALEIQTPARSMSL